MQRLLLSVTGALAALALVGSHGAEAQGLADYDYENLSFRGISIEGGYVFPDRIEGTGSIGGRLDLGFLGPGLRIVPFVSYWSADFDADEVTRLENQVRDLIIGQGGDPVTVDLGRVEWSDLIIGVDGHFVWNVPLGLMTYLGAGAAAHILNGEGPAVADTFVEDLLDSVRAGINFHTGIERPLGDRFRLYSSGRFEILEDLQYFEVRFGGQLTFGGGEQEGS